MTELTKIISELKELQRMEEQLTAEMDSLKDQIKAAMADTDTATFGEYKVTYKPVTTSRLDTKGITAFSARKPLNPS